MGVIDHTNYEVSCPNCCAKESFRILDKGSGYGGSHWQGGPSSELFGLQWTAGGGSEPDLLKAVCKKCGTVATVRRS